MELLITFIQRSNVSQKFAQVALNEYQSPGKCQGCNPSQERLHLINLVRQRLGLDFVDYGFRQANRAK